MSKILTNKNWPVPTTSEQMLNDPEIQKAMKNGQKFQLTFRVVSGHVGEVNPEHEKRREQAERDGKSRL